MTPPTDPSHVTSGGADAAGMEQLRSARSFLFVPGDRPDRFAKAAAAGADVVILDLEDAVGPDHKGTAREAVVGWLADGHRAAVRINAVDSPEHAADLEALEGLRPGAGTGAGTGEHAGLVGVVVPKAADPGTVSAIASRVGAPVIALVESAAGMVNAVELARAEGVARLAFGHLDYAADLGSESTRVAMTHGRSTLVMASRAAGLPGPVDGVTTALDDPTELADDLAHADELGMGGKLLIHPKQVGPTLAAYRPSEAELAWAHKVVSAARTSGGGAVRVDGAMVDAPVVARAEEILRRQSR
ncbi:HpcH/HpaI aldolase/citrate lyase family protein [Ornithinimicrobium panacihumi]|uniref:HpcH/HpaI aldolase/citrate lyase family protein n=1 Tax=Ornithinimicrobium panacihumi TaxID=2008449 RepID=UPI003F8BD473